MINLKNLISLFPSWYKDNDTYKDSSGKGLLERFLEVCGEYFKDNISKEIDEAVDLLDIDTTHEMYLNFIWEFFGKIPYSYGAIYRGSIWSFYENPKYDKEMWDKNLDQVPRASYRDLLKYAISLYKIRGTHDFYNILMGFYDMEVELEDPSMGGQTIIRDTPYYDSGLLYDSGSLYDESLDCLGCTEVKLTITSFNRLSSDEEKLVLLLLNRFRPVNVTPFSKDNTEFKFKNWSWNYELTTVPTSLSFVGGGESHPIQIISTKQVKDNKNQELLGDKLPAEYSTSITGAGFIYKDGAVIAEPNQSEESRSGKLTITQTDGKVLNVNLNQAMGVVTWTYNFSASPTSISAAGGGQTIRLVTTSTKQKYINGVLTGGTVQVGSTRTVEGPAGMISFNVDDVIVSPNQSESSRSAKIKITQAETGDELDILTIQAAGVVTWTYAISVTPTSWAFNTLGETKSFVVNSTRQKYINGVLTGLPEPVAYSNTISGSGFTLDGNKVVAAINPTDALRSGTVTIRQNSSEKEAHISLSQAAGTVTYEYSISVSPNFLILAGPGESKPLPTVTSRRQKYINGILTGSPENVGYTPIINGAGFSLNGNMVVAAPNQSETSRIGSVSLKQDVSGKAATVSLSQSAGVVTWTYAFTWTAPSVIEFIANGETKSIGTVTSTRQKYINGVLTGSPETVNFSSSITNASEGSTFSMVDSTTVKSNRNDEERVHTATLTLQQSTSGKLLSTTLSQAKQSKVYHFTMVNSGTTSTAAGQEMSASIGSTFTVGQAPPVRVPIALVNVSNSSIVSPSDIVITEAAGNPPTEYVVRFTTKPNFTDTARSTTITFTQSDSGEVIVWTIVQAAAAPWLSFSPTVKELARNNVQGISSRYPLTELVQPTTELLTISETLNIYSHLESPTLASLAPITVSMVDATTTAATKRIIVNQVNTGGVYHYQVTFELYLNLTGNLKELYYKIGQTGRPSAGELSIRATQESGKVEDVLTTTPASFSFAGTGGESTFTYVARKDIYINKFWASPAWRVNPWPYFDMTTDAWLTLSGNNKVIAPANQTEASRNANLILRMYNESAKTSILKSLNTPATQAAGNVTYTYSFKFRDGQTMTMNYGYQGSPGDEIFDQIISTRQKYINGVLTGSPEVVTFSPSVTGSGFSYIVGPNSLKIVAELNEGPSRSGQITLTQAGSNNILTIGLHQMSGVVTYTYEFRYSTGGTSGMAINITTPEASSGGNIYNAFVSTRQKYIGGNASGSPEVVPYTPVVTGEGFGFTTGPSELRITATANTGPARQGTLTLTQQGSGNKMTATIYQVSGVVTYTYVFKFKADATMFIEIPNEGSSTGIEIFDNILSTRQKYVGGNISGSPEVVAFNPVVSGVGFSLNTGPNSIKVLASPNSDSERHGIVTLTQDGSGNLLVVNLTQLDGRVTYTYEFKFNGGDTLTSNFTAAGATDDMMYFIISRRQKYIAGVASGSPEFAPFTGVLNGDGFSMVLDGTTFDVTAEPNTGAERSGTIDLTQIGSNKTLHIGLYQMGALPDYVFTIQPMSFDLISSAQEISFEVLSYKSQGGSPVRVPFLIGTVPSWMNEPVITETGSPQNPTSYTVKISVKTNIQFNPRTLELPLTQSETGDTKLVTVTQAGGGEIEPGGFVTITITNLPIDKAVGLFNSASVPTGTELQYILTVNNSGSMDINYEISVGLSVNHTTMPGTLVRMLPHTTIYIRYSLGNGLWSSAMPVVLPASGTHIIPWSGPIM